MPILEGGNIIEGATGLPSPFKTDNLASGAGFKVARAKYSFASEGGTAGTIALTGSTGIPANSVIFGGYVDVQTIPVGSGASIAVQVEGANDIVSAAAISGAPWSSTGRKSVVPAFTGATTVLTTAARDISAVISAANLTAGIFEVFLFYVTTS